MWRSLLRRWHSGREPIYTEALSEFYERMERETRSVSYSEFMDRLSSSEASRYLRAFDRWLVKVNPKATGQDFYWRSVLLSCFFPNPRQEQADLQRAAGLEPGNVDVWVSLGHLALQQNREQEAINYYEQGVKVGPTNFFPWYGQALAYMHLGRFEEALGKINVAIEIYPHPMWGYETRGQIHEKMGNLKEALADLDFVVLSGQASSETRRLQDQIRIRMQRKQSKELEHPDHDGYF